MLLTHDGRPVSATGVILAPAASNDDPLGCKHSCAIDCANSGYSCIRYVVYAINDTNMNMVGEKRVH